MTNNSFPLLRLPDNARIQVLKNMKYVELTAFSLLSRKAKTHIKSLGIKASKIVVEIWECSLVLEVSFRYSQSLRIHLYKCKNFIAHNFKLNAERPCNVTVSPHLSAKSQNWKIKRRLNTKEWIEHLSSIFNFSEPPHLDFDCEQESFKTRAIREFFPEISGLAIGARQTFAREILSLFLSDSKCKDLRFECEPFANEPSVSFQRVGIQNLNYVDFSIFSKITLDDLLTFNYHYIDISEFCSVTVKVANRFIKIWMKDSNPKLKWIRIMFYEALDEETLLRGIPYKVVPETTEKTIDAENYRIRLIIKGGLDVRNKRGITANVRLKSYGGSGSKIELYVIN